VNGTALLAWLRSHPRTLCALLCVCCLGGGAAGGAWIFPRSKIVDKTHETIVTHTEWSAYRVEVKGETVYKDRVVTHFIFGQTGAVTEETVEEDKTSDATTTTTSTSESGKAAEHLDLTTSHTSTPTADRFLASVGLGVQPLQGAAISALVELDARIIGPFHGGAALTVPLAQPQNFTVYLKAGVSFGQ
jgi:hypothetical protein